MSLVSSRGGCVKGKRVCTVVLGVLCELVVVCSARGGGGNLSYRRTRVCVQCSRYGCFSVMMCVLVLSYSRIILLSWSLFCDHGPDFIYLCTFLIQFIIFVILLQFIPN